MLAQDALVGTRYAWDMLAQDRQAKDTHRICTTGYVGTENVGTG
jgi:hypothetical protein